MIEQATECYSKDGKTIRYHELKTWKEYYLHIVNPDIESRKTVEIRKNDRDYKKGDYLYLREYDNDKKEYTDNYTFRLVTHIFDAQPWLNEGYIAMSIIDKQPNISL